MLHTLITSELTNLPVICAHTKIITKPVSGSNSEFYIYIRLKKIYSMVNDDFSLVNHQATAGSARNIFNQVFIELN